MTGLVKWIQLSKQHLLSIALVGKSVTLIKEKQNYFDIYGRTLAYILLLDDTCLNGKMIKDGFSKPFSKYYCKD